MRKRIVYLILTLLLLGIEILIGVFVNDSFIRPYFGDVLVVILIYTLIRIFFPSGLPFLPLGIFLFAVCVEVAQYFHIADLLHLERFPLLRVIVGTSFSWTDILCYAVGCLTVAAVEWIAARRK